MVRLEHPDYVTELLLSVQDGVGDIAPAYRSCSWQEYAQPTLDCCHSLGIPLKARNVAPLKTADMKNWGHAPAGLFGPLHCEV